METAAAILTHILYTSDVFASSFENEGIPPGSPDGSSFPDKIASEVRPYYEAMLKMVREANR